MELFGFPVVETDDEPDVDPPILGDFLIYTEWVIKLKPPPGL